MEIDRGQGKITPTIDWWWKCGSGYKHCSYKMPCGRCVSDKYDHKCDSHLLFLPQPIEERCDECLYRFRCLTKA